MTPLMKALLTGLLKYETQSPVTSGVTLTQLAAMQVEGSQVQGELSKWRREPSGADRAPRLTGRGGGGGGEAWNYALRDTGFAARPRCNL